ncbi:hypothetical protein BO70DRAFT_393134 [Aspergillus heteromorphus CBS 117.55]|uniref:Uncharacterized protein n=1 Tax=Aspergillus heteromorphus CBS 117.55 TaxID=1448321 RepID=A0A317WX83_9EURO|nr:uncharacterized protein BO70DRAFT_393134 [Aspergillus heteromorphus CBS 117.55]PWY89942.1 hypothetical protein BO70DRAFT_393134 [Aspergillus heteromorphus CBS 117.55]
MEYMQDPAHPGQGTLSSAQENCEQLERSGVELMRYTPTSGRVIVRVQFSMNKVIVHGGKTPYFILMAANVVLEERIRQARWANPPWQAGLVTVTFRFAAQTGDPGHLFRALRAELQMMLLRLSRSPLEPFPQAWNSICHVQINYEPDEHRRFELRFGGP